MFCSLGMGLAQISNYMCGSKGLPGLMLAKSFLFCYVTEDKIIHFSLRDCQHHAKGSTGAAAAPAGINDGLCVGRQPRPCPQILDHGSCSWGHKPQLGRAALDRAQGVMGAQCPAQGGCSKNICWMKIQREKNRGTQNYFHFHWLTDSFMHSLIHSFIQ